MNTSRPERLMLFQPPYRMLIPLARADSVCRVPDEDGLAVVWCLGDRPSPDTIRLLRRRPGGVALIVVLPRANEWPRPQDLFAMVDQCRPQSILPFHDQPNMLDLRTVLSREPQDLPGTVVDYLGWRGLVLDMDLRRTIRRILELSDEVRTVSGLARGLYVSRRALGRRFLREGLPVPSHWLQFGRLLRVALSLQRPGATLMETAFAHGYPDGFSLSNQMKRLLGVRPSALASRLGWEWIAERWIRQEIEGGGFHPSQVQLLERHAPRPEKTTGQEDDRRPA